jgi:hypothetical protein
MSAPNTIRWFVKPSFDEPKLRSPQPCARGSHCDYKRWNPATEQMEPAVCHFVHPGEEGTGRRLFPARQVDGREQPACVRLTGAGRGFYERCSRRMPWSLWCAEKRIPYEPVVQGVPWEHVTIERIGGPKAPQTPQRPPAARPPPMAPRRSRSANLSIEEWLTTASPQELADYQRQCEEERDAREPDCVYCDPSSGCDGDHGEEMRDGFLLRRRAMNPILAYAQQTAAAAEVVSDLSVPDANGRMWYDSRTPVGALAQALMANQKLEKAWHPALTKIMEGATPEELAAELGPADLANIERTPYHYAEHVVSRAQRELMAKTIVVDEQHQQIEAELNAIMDA